MDRQESISCKIIGFIYLFMTLAIFIIYLTYGKHLNDMKQSILMVIALIAFLNGIQYHNFYYVFKRIENIESKNE